MRVFHTKEAAIFFTVAVFTLFYGCGQSVDHHSDGGGSKPIPVRTPVPTVANDGLSQVDSIIPSGASFVSAGVGTRSGGTEHISVDIPDNASVKKVYLYWARKGPQDNPASPQIEVNGKAYTGKIVGGPIDVEGSNVPDEAGVTYRVDLTDSINIAPNTATLSVSVKDKLTEPTKSEGASLLVFYTTNGTNYISSLYEGADWAWPQSKAADQDQQTALRQTDPVTFTFDSTDVERKAKLLLLIGDIGNGKSSLKIAIGDNMKKIANPLPFEHKQGLQWDNYVKTLTIPAGVHQVRVYPIAGPDSATSLLWSLAGFSIPAP
jgi:hypothetical protein